MLLLRLQGSIEVGCCSSTIDKEISSGDEGPLRAHKQFSHIRNFIGCTRPSGWTLGEHVLIKIATRTVEFIKSERSHNNTRRYGIDTEKFHKKHQNLHISTESFTFDL